jgi:3-phenylpropionate/trans-cinnamate dioxygenase ferredoxin subunit
VNDTDLQGWEFVCSTAELLPGEMRTVWAGDTAIVVFNLDGALYALEDRCSHEEFELSAGPFDAVQGTVECVLHGARFDVRDGRPLCAPAYEPVAKFPVRVANGGVWTRDDRA